MGTFAYVSETEIVPEKSSVDDFFLIGKFKYKTQSHSKSTLAVTTNYKQYSAKKDNFSEQEKFDSEIEKASKNCLDFAGGLFDTLKNAFNFLKKKIFKEEIENP